MGTLESRGGGVAHVHWTQIVGFPFTSVEALGVNSGAA
jgi:hypothetical protein